MLPRISSYVLALVVVVAVGAVRVNDAQAKEPLESPLQLTSLEWLAADNDVIVRGAIAEITTDQNWSIVTFDVRETLKGAKAQRLQFALQKFDKGEAALAQAKASKQELVWILKRQAADARGQAPDREQLLTRNKIDLYAPFLPGRPGEPTYPVIPLLKKDSQSQMQPASFLSMDLRPLKTAEEQVAALRAAIAEPQGKETAKTYALALPLQIADRTGFSRQQNRFAMPIDHRLEELARRLVQTPADFLSENTPEQRQFLRLEGVKALRLFRSEQNLAILRAWLDDPMSTEPIAKSGNSQSPRLVPSAAKVESAENKITLPTDLRQVPEISFQQHLTKEMKSPDAQLHTAVNIDGVTLMNQKRRDGFIEALITGRPDLSGLSFAMGDACRMKPEAGKQFVAALDVFHKAENIKMSATDPAGVKNLLMNSYKDQASEKGVAPSASVAALMQVLAPEDGDTRLALAKYLEGLSNTEATRALAKLAIFSGEADVRTAALEALNKRDDKDYTEILEGGLKYPWPAVAERTGEAIVKLGRKDLVPRLIDVLENADPRAPQTQESGGKKSTVVRELVRLNHHHNCLLCHAPVRANLETVAKDDSVTVEGMSAQVPVPSESMVAYYRPSVPDILVRFDITYLRQDFSMKLPVANADPWPDMQRYDFLVRTREVSAKEAAEYRQLLQPSSTEELSPYQRTAQTALRELTGLDAAPNAAAWRKAVAVSR